MLPRQFSIDPLNLMPTDKKHHTLRFSVGSLLSITAALAVGLAVGLSPLPDPEVWEADMRWLQGLLCSGVVLLACELFRQVLLLGRQCRSAESETKTALVIAVFQRLALAMLLSGLLILQLLLSRRAIEVVQRTERYVYPELWPSLMLTVTILGAIRILLHSRDHQSISATKSFVTGSIIYVGLIGIAIFIFSNLFEHVAMGHFAMNSLEINNPINLQRTGFYPHHTAEGFRTFWLSAIAALGIVLIAGLLWLHTTVKKPLLRIFNCATFLMLITCEGVYVYWFVGHELPRISPDVASAGTSQIWSDTVALAVLLFGLATSIGLQLSRKRQRISGRVVKLPSISAKGKLAVYMICFATGVHANVLLCQYSITDTPRSLLSFLAWFLPLPGWLSWENYIGTLGEAILQSEVLLTMMLFVSALSLAWQTVRKPNAEPLLQPVAGMHVLCYSLASLALLVVAVPAFAIFGFCYWLGPLVL